MLELDSFRTQQVVINLLSNALKFSKAYDIIEVKLQVLPIEQSEEVELQIDVTDNGCGISEQDQLQVFTPYFKMTNKSSLAKNGYGNGIGLSICQRIVSRLNGSISVQSKIDEGSTFTVRFRTKKSEIQINAKEKVSKTSVSLFRYPNLKMFSASVVNPLTKGCTGEGKKGFKTNHLKRWAQLNSTRFKSLNRRIWKARQRILRSQTPATQSMSRKLSPASGRLAR